MWSIRKPTSTQIQATLAVQVRLPFTYHGVGGTRDQNVPPGYRSVHYRTRLGEGAGTFERACLGLRRWQQFPTEMVEIHPRDVLLETGNAVGVLIRQGGIWFLNATRIVYTIDQTNRRHQATSTGETVSSIKRFGFGYGTLPCHMEAGEERFLIEWDQRDDSVWYDLHMFCTPGRLMAQAMDWRVRQLQRRFASLSAAAMQRLANVQRGVGSEERAVSIEV